MSGIEPRRIGPGTRAEYRFGLVLILLLVTFVFYMAGSSLTWTRPIGVALVGATLLASFYAADVSRRFRRLAALGASIAFVGSLSLVAVGKSGEVTASLLSAALVFLAPIVIVKSVLRRRIVDGQTILAALCVYVLFGLMWTFIYMAIGEWGSSAFFKQPIQPTSADYLYFSFITQLTVGYGDLTAAGNLGRACAVLEALLGQIYLVTVVALLVTRVVPRGPGGASPADA